MSMKSPGANPSKLPVAVKRVEELGAIVQSARREQGMTQIDVAGLAGFGNRFIVDLEKGKPTCSLDKALRVVQMLGIELTAKLPEPSL